MKLRKTLAVTMAVAMLISLSPAVLALPRTSNRVKTVTLNDALNYTEDALEFMIDGTGESFEPFIAVEEGGRTYAESTNHEDSTMSAVFTTREFAAGDVIAFEYMTSTEEEYDKLFVMLLPEGEVLENATTLLAASGENDWQSVVLDPEITESGTYSVYWVYSKDVSNSMGDDIVCIDNVLCGTAPACTGISFANESYSVALELTFQTSVVPVPMYASLSGITYETDDDTVATIDEDGILTGVGLGLTTVTATMGEFTATAEVRVYDLVAEINSVLNVEGGELEFELPEEYPMLVAEDGDRTVAISSNVGVDDSGSSVSLNVEAAAGDILMFDCKISCEDGYDALFVVVNENPVIYFTGEYDWSTSVIEFEEDGTYEIMFIYQKDSSDYYGSDCAWLDNVYIGERPELEGIEFLNESVSIGIGTAYAGLEIVASPTGAMIPEDAEFVMEDEAVASFDENGVIVGLSEGETALTVTTGEISAELPVSVTTDTFANGFLLYDENLPIADIWMLFNTTECVTLNNGRSLLSGSVYAAEYVDGMVYGYTQSDDGNTFFVMDYLTRKIVSEVDVDFTCFDMAYDYSSATMYGLAMDAAEEGRAICTIDLETGEQLSNTPLVMPDSDSIALTLACSLSGKLYTALYGANEFGTISATTGEFTKISGFDFEISYIQSMAFDHNTETLYWAICTDGIADLRTIDVTTGEDTLVIEATGEIAGLFFTFEMPNPIAVTGIESQVRSFILDGLETDFITYQIIPENATNRRVTYTAEDESILAVSSKGEIRGLANGVTTVTVTTKDGGFTLTYNVLVQNIPNNLFYEDFEDGMAGWTTIDADGDGFTWELSSDDFDDYEGDGSIASASYINEIGKLTPDNWLISPVIELSGESISLMWYADGQDKADFAENYTVYIGGEDAAAPADFTEVLATEITGTNWESVICDISEHAGENVRIAFRHHDVTNMYWMKLDAISVVAASELTNKMFGDATQDGKVNTGDAVMLLRMAAGILSMPEGEQQVMSDMNKDGKINTGDAVAILKYAAGLPV